MNGQKLKTDDLRSKAQKLLFDRLTQESEIGTKFADEFEKLSDQASYCLGQTIMKDLAPKIDNLISLLGGSELSR